MAMASHPRLGGISIARGLGHDALQLVLAVLMRGSPPPPLPEDPTEP